MTPINFHNTSILSIPKHRSHVITSSHHKIITNSNFNRRDPSIVSLLCHNMSKRINFLQMRGSILTSSQQIPLVFINSNGENSGLVPRVDPDWLRLVVGPHARRPILMPGHHVHPVREHVQAENSIARFQGLGFDPSNVLTRHLFDFLIHHNIPSLDVDDPCDTILSTSDDILVVRGEFQCVDGRRVVLGFEQACLVTLKLHI